MALERVPADIRKNGGVARMSDPHIINEIKSAVTIPVMAKSRIGHFVEAQILEALGKSPSITVEEISPGASPPRIIKEELLSATRKSLPSSALPPASRCSH